MTLKSDAKFENKTGSKNDMKNFLNFNARGGKSESLHFDVFYFCRKYIMFKPKSTEELCVITLNNDEKFEDEMTCGLKNDMRNLSNVDPTLRSLKICSLMGFF